MESIHPYFWFPAFILFYFFDQGSLLLFIIAGAFCYSSFLLFILSFRTNSVVRVNVFFFSCSFLFFVLYFFSSLLLLFCFYVGGSTSTRSISILFSLLFKKDRFVENAREHGAHKLDHSDRPITFVQITCTSF